MHPYNSRTPCDDKHDAYKLNFQAKYNGCNLHSFVINPPVAVLRMNLTLRWIRISKKWRNFNKELFAFADRSFVGENLITDLLPASRHSAVSLCGGFSFQVLLVVWLNYVAIFFTVVFPGSCRIAVVGVMRFLRRYSNCTRNFSVFR